MSICPHPSGCRDVSGHLGECSTRRLSALIPGTPAPQGSKRAFAHRTTGRIVVVESSKAVKPWRKVMHDALVAAANDTDWLPLDGPAAVHLRFYLPRPKSVKREYPTVKPDLDKLVRAALDALTSSGVLADDARVVDMAVSKRYADLPALQVTVEPLA